MKSTYKLVWSDEALKNLKHIIQYLEEQWSHREIQKFSRLLDHQLLLMQQNPYLFPTSEKSKKLRKSVLTRQTTIFYKIVGYEVRIISLFDSRQDPNKVHL